jgi:uncharacterized membrane protein
MDLTHIHLLANHLPVVGSLSAIFVLIYGLITRSLNTRNAAYFLFIFAAVGAVITYLTGEAAEHRVENLAGISEVLVEEHEDLGLYALISMVALGCIALLSLVLTVKKSSLAVSMAYITLMVAFVSFGITAYTANSGGKIRHTELSGETGILQSPEIKGNKNKKKKAKEEDDYD